MGETRISVERYIPQTSIFSTDEPSCQPFAIRLVYWPNAEPSPCYTINTPTACLPATGRETAEDLIRMTPGTYASADEAIAQSRALCPHWQANVRIRERLLSNHHHYGPFVGNGKTADEFDVSVFRVLEYARGLWAMPKTAGRRKAVRA